MIKFLDLYQQYLSLRPAIDEAIENVIRETAFIGGAELSSFEKAFFSYQQAQHCVGVANGTDALEIALEMIRAAADSSCEIGQRPMSPGL